MPGRVIESTYFVLSNSINLLRMPIHQRLRLLRIIRTRPKTEPTNPLLPIHITHALLQTQLLPFAHNSDPRLINRHSTIQPRQTIRRIQKPIFLEQDWLLEFLLRLSVIDNPLIRPLNSFGPPIGIQVESPESSFRRARVRRRYSRRPHQHTPNLNAHNHGCASTQNSTNNQSRQDPSTNSIPSRDCDLGQLRSIRLTGASRISIPCTRTRALHVTPPSRRLVYQITLDDLKYGHLLSYSQTAVIRPRRPL